MSPAAALIAASAAASAAAVNAAAHNPAPADPAPTAPGPRDAISAFVAAGLAAKSPCAMRPKDYGPAPYVCTGVRFLIPSLGPNFGGRVFGCDTQEDRDLLAKHYRSLARITALAFSWVEPRGHLLLQINGTLPEREAKKYFAALPDAPLAATPAGTLSDCAE